MAHKTNSVEVITMVSNRFLESAINVDFNHVFQNDPKSPHNINIFFPGLSTSIRTLGPGYTESVALCAS